MNPTKLTCCTRVVRLAGLALSLTLLPLAHAEDVFVTSYKGATTSADVMPCPPSCSLNTSMSGSSASSTASPTPVIPASDRRIIFGITNISPTLGTTYWSVQPLDAQYTAGSGKTYTFTSLQHPGGIYKIYITRGSGTTTHSTNLVMAVTLNEGQLLDTNQVPQSSLTIPFPRSGPTNTWIPIGYLTNTTASPILTFTYASGTVDSTGNRWNMDAVYFQFVGDPCTAGGVAVAPQVSPAGPLVAGGSFVNVSGIKSGATNVSVFANGAIVGTTNKAGAGFTNSIVSVPIVTPFNKDDDMTASQSISNCTSSLPGSGVPAGGGANPSIAVMIACSKNANLHGPVGATGTLGSAYPYIVGADHLTSGFNTAPQPGTVLQPGACWQTASFNVSDGVQIDMNGGTAVTDNNPFCAFEGLVFSMDALDSGPYDIYIGRIVNGDTVIEDFQNSTVGTTGMFASPSGSPTFAPPSVYLDNSTSTTISTNHAYAGTKSCRIQWQWVNNSDQRWAHIIANGAGGGTAYPQIDTTKPVTIYYLILPVGTTDDSMHFTSAPANTSAGVGSTATLSVGVAGPGTFSYQWSKNGSDLSNGGNIAGATSSALTLSSLALADSGTYKVTVNQNGGSSCSGSVQAVLTVSQFVQPSSLTFNYAAPNLTLNWTAGILQSNVALLGTNNVWTDVPGATSPYPVTPSRSQTFYRVRGQ